MNYWRTFCPTCPPLDNIWVVMIDKIPGKIIRTVLCWIVQHNGAQSNAHWSEQFSQRSIKCLVSRVKRCNILQVTWLAITEIRSESFGLVLYAKHIFLQILLIFSYVMPPGQCHYNTLSCDTLLCGCCHIFHRRVWYHELSPCYVCSQSSGIILIS